MFTGEVQSQSSLYSSKQALNPVADARLATAITTDYVKRSITICLFPCMQQWNII
jgi:hypothetical protein